MTARSSELEELHEHEPTTSTPAPGPAGATVTEMGAHDEVLASVYVHDDGAGPSGTPVGAPVVVPDIVGVDVLAAHASARRSGLRVAVTIWETKIGPWGLVLSQRPEPGAQVRLATSIHVVVAGRPHLAVPDVRGLAASAAIEELRRVGLQPVTSEERSSRSLPAGRVISTRPSAGSLVVDGSRVSLVVSRPSKPRPRPSDDAARRDRT